MSESKSKFRWIGAFFDVVLPAIGFLALWLCLMVTMLTAIETVVETKANARRAVEHEQRIAALEVRVRQQPVETTIGRDALSLRP
jgi:hypothetical protein